MKQARLMLPQGCGRGQARKRHNCGQKCRTKQWKQLPASVGATCTSPDLRGRAVSTLGSVTVFWGSTGTITRQVLPFYWDGSGNQI